MCFCRIINVYWFRVVIEKKIEGFCVYYLYLFTYTLLKTDNKILILINIMLNLKIPINK